MQDRHQLLGRLRAHVAADQRLFQFIPQGVGDLVVRQRFVDAPEEAACAFQATTKRIAEEAANALFCRFWLLFLLSVVVVVFFVVLCLVSLIGVLHLIGWRFILGLVSVLFNFCVLRFVTFYGCFILGGRKRHRFSLLIFAAKQALYALEHETLYLK